jgi:hypothetical protein
MISHWERLLGIARSIIDQSGIGDDWTFGGGTAMMIHIGHRLSHDIDLFVDDHSSSVTLIQVNRASILRSGRLLIQEAEAGF